MLEDKAQAEVLCSPCKQLIPDLNWQLKRTQNESPSKRLKRQDPSAKQDQAKQYFGYKICITYI